MKQVLRLCHRPWGERRAANNTECNTLISEEHSLTAAALSLYSFFMLCTVKISCLVLWSQVAGEHKYHPECFVCLSCKVVIEDRDTYALVERSKLYW